MKIVKPSKQTVLKGLLLLVVGLNFSWRPLVQESHEATMASEIPDAVKVTVRGNEHQKSAADIAHARDPDPKDPTSTYVRICDGKNITLQKDLTGNYRVIATNDSKEILNCQHCMDAIVTTPDILPKDIVQMVQDSLKVSCDDMLTDKEKQAIADKKAELALDMIKCVSDKKGNDLDADRKLDCETKHATMSDSEMKKAGIDKDDAKKLREELAKSALKDAKTQMNADVKACKKSHKEDDNFDDCDTVLAKYDDILSRFSDSDNKILNDGSKSLTDKLTKFEAFVAEEKKANERLDYFKTQYDSVNTNMQKAYDGYANRCDSLASTTYANQNFDTAACTQAYVKQLLLPKYEPVLRNLKTQFTSEENKFFRDFTADSKMDLVGTDGAAAALAPFRDYTKQLANYGANYMLPSSDLPQFADNAASGTATASGLAGNDLSGRFGTLAGARQFTPLAANQGATGPGGTGSPFAIPSILSGTGTSGARYNAVLPMANIRQNRAVTNGIFLQDASIVYQ